MHPNKIATYKYKDDPDSSVSNCGYGMDDQEIGVRFPARGGDYFLRHYFQRGSGTHPASCPTPGVKRLTTLPYLMPKFKNDRSYTSILPGRHSLAWCFNYLNKETFTYYQTKLGEISYSYNIRPVGLQLLLHSIINFGLHTPDL